MYRMMSSPFNPLASVLRSSDLSCSASAMNESGVDQFQGPLHQGSTNFYVIAGVNALMRMGILHSVTEI